MVVEEIKKGKHDILIIFAITFHSISLIQIHDVFCKKTFGWAGHTSNFCTNVNPIHTCPITSLVIKIKSQLNCQMLTTLNRDFGTVIQLRNLSWNFILVSFFREELKNVVDRLYWQIIVYLSQC